MHFRKELIRFFCCPTVKIVSLQECQAGAFWCHEFLWPMERQNKVIKTKLSSIFFCKKFVFDIMNGWNQALGLLIHLKGKNCTISAITALVLHGLSRSHRLHKQISAETKLPLPKPYRPVTTNPSYFYSAAFEQSPCLQNEVEDEFLDEIFW